MHFIHILSTPNYTLYSWFYVLYENININERHFVTFESLHLSDTLFSNLNTNSNHEFRRTTIKESKPSVPRIFFVLPWLLLTAISKKKKERKKNVRDQGEKAFLIRLLEAADKIVLWMGNDQSDLSLDTCQDLL